jgi:hypothetical protein
MLPAVALKVVVAELAGTVMVAAGTGSNALLLESETVVPPAGLGPLSVTVQLVFPDVPKLAGLQAKEVSVVAADPGPVTVPPVPETAND